MNTAERVIKMFSEASGEKRIAEPRGEPRRPTVATKPSKWQLIFPVIGLAVAAWFGFAYLYTEYLWFSDMGFAGVFSTIWTAMALASLTAGIGAGVLTWINLRLAVPSESSSREDVAEIADFDEKPEIRSTLKRAPTIAAIVVGLLAGFTALGAWETIMRYLYQVPFGAADPLFGRDIAFYVFTLPALDWVSSVLFLLLLVNAIGAAVMYLAGANFKFDRQTQKFSNFKFPPKGRAHLLGLAAAAFLLVAWNTYLSISHLPVTSGSGFFGADYADVNAAMPLLWAQIAAASLAAVFAVICIYRRTNRLILAGTGLLVLTVAAGWAYPALVERFSVAPNELVMETPFIQHNIDATRAAFDLNRVEERELSGSMALTAGDIEENRRTVNNIRLWDQQPLLDTFGQIQEIRTYYEFNSVDNDRYVINGEMQQVMISPRELNAATLPNLNWINEHLTFTHGYGAVVGPVDKVTSEGMPELFVKNIPPESSAPELKIDRPEIYFGEMSNERVYVNTKTEEFNHPAGDQNVFRSYTGPGGISVRSTFDQMLFASRYFDLKLLLSNDFTAESKILAVRNIRDRLEKVAPYLRYDNDPYMVINEGKLVWIADAYTTTNLYPYSQRVDGINYIRNSVKATVDAYNGTISLYVADANDPIIQTYAKIFPNTLKPLAEMPESLRAHLRYPEDKFHLQARVFATYHMDKPQEFYNKEDQWTIAQMQSVIPNAAAKPVAGNPAAPNLPPGAIPNPNPDSRPMEPYYTIMKLPGEQKEEFILMMPFTPQRKDNLAAWMVARSDGENYGKLAAYRFPKQQLVFGPKQIAARINQDPEISRQLTLWNQGGSRVIFGTVMVIPIKESVIYVQPLYFRAESGRIPELRRVIVASDNRIAMQETLDKSLASLFGGETKPADKTKSPTGTGENQTAAPTDSAGLLEQARQQYQLALEAQRAGDWAKYGEEVRRLGATLERMSEQQR